MDYQEELSRRIATRSKRSLLDVNTLLEHFAIVSYRVPVERMSTLIPKPFKLWTYFVKGKEYALVSAVTFKDKDFSFYRISRFPKFNFYQTNFRAYIYHETTMEPLAWFFGTTLGSITNIIPKKRWKMPWNRGKYSCDFELQDHKYLKYKMNFKSKFGESRVDIESSDKPMELTEGFDTLEQQKLILTHPVIGYYHSGKSNIGTYEIWHQEMNMHHGRAKDLYYGQFDDLGFLSASEMKKPHSILLTKEIEFDILLPPRMVDLTKIR